MSAARPARARRGSAFLLVVIAAASCTDAPADYAERVTIRRTSYGVPHILAEDLGAMSYGLAWAHMEDYGRLVVERLTMARGERSLHEGEEYVESDFWWKRRYGQAAEAYPALGREAQELYEGYAAAVNRYIEMYPDRVQDWATPEYTGVDVAAHWVDETLDGAIRRFQSSREARRAARDSAAASGDGSNAWALGPSLTESGKAILVRNPHLSWGAGRYSVYYEAQITVPGVVDFYGDFRVGYPMYFNGGFNERLGWATTNNSPDVEEFYALTVDPDDPDAYLFDGGSVPVTKTVVSVDVRDDAGVRTVTREFLETEVGPVVERTSDTLYVVRSADWGEYRRTEQFLRMMKAGDLEEWKSAMRMRAMKESSFTYADADGNIFYVWNAAIPALPHPSGRDTIAIPVSSSEQVWSDLVPFDSLPQILNPPSGYLHNENDSFHYTNLESPIATPSVQAAWPEPRLRLRSQLAVDLLRGVDDMSLEEVIDLKHSPRMLLAERVLDDLLEAVRATRPTGLTATGLRLLEQWDRTSQASSRGGVLFKIWVELYEERGGDYAILWTADAPIDTPTGLNDPVLAAETFAEAVRLTRERYGSVDVAWGDVHRVRWGDVDEPVSGCPSTLGCFRHLAFEPTEDGRLRAYSGDAWILAVEFDSPPRAYSVLVFGQTGDETSPHYDDQTPLFASEMLKPVRFTEAEIAEDLVRSYTPGP